MKNAWKEVFLTLSGDRWSHPRLSRTDLFACFCRWICGSQRKVGSFRL